MYYAGLKYPSLIGCCCCWLWWEGNGICVVCKVTGFGASVFTFRNFYQHNKTELMQWSITCHLLKCSTVQLVRWPTYPYQFSLGIFVPVCIYYWNMFHY